MLSKLGQSPGCSRLGPLLVLLAIVLGLRAHGEDTNCKVVAVQGNDVAVSCGTRHGVRVGMNAQIEQEVSVNGRPVRFPLARIVIATVNPNEATAQVLELGPEWTLAPNMYVVFEETLVPLPADATLTIESETGGTAYVDDRRIGPTPQELSLSPGRHRVRIEKPGWSATTREVDLEAGARLSISVDPRRRVVALTVVTEPRDTLVTVDGQQKGRTPLRLETVLVETRLVRIEKNGFSPYEQSLDIQQDHELRVALERDFSSVTELKAEADRLYDAGQFELAAERYRTLAEDFPSHPEANYARAMAESCGEKTKS